MPTMHPPLTLLPLHQIELTLTWKYDPSFKKAKPLISKSPSRRGRGSSEADEPKPPKNDLMLDDDDEVEHTLSIVELEALDVARKERVAKAKKQMEIYNAQVSEARPGDYQVQCHVLEAQQLKGESSSGMSNPRVIVKCSPT